MHLSSCFGPPISIEEQPSGDLLAPVRDINDLSIVSKAWWTVHLPLDDARRPDVPATVGRPYSGHRSLRSPHLCNVRARRARAHQRRPRDRGRSVFFACDQAFHVAERGHVALIIAASWRPSTRVLEQENEIPPGLWRLGLVQGSGPGLGMHLGAVGGACEIVNACRL